MTCRHCQAELPPNRRLYCGRRCEDKWRYHNNPKRKAEQREGHSQWRVRNGMDPLRELDDPLLRVRVTSCEIPWRDCSECGTRFIALKGGAGRTRCATHSQSNAARKQRSAEREWTCECGSIVDTHGKKCETCRRATKATRRRRDKIRRRSLIVSHEPYTMAEIADRDQNRCGLCGKRVAMAKAVPYPNAPTIDHILPLSKGGHDTRANVQLAHFHCNSAKKQHAHPTDQLRLVG